MEATPADAERTDPYADSLCFGCSTRNTVGLRLDVHHEGDGTGWATFTPQPEHEGPPGFLHGGLAATALDETMAWVAHQAEGEACVTATLSLRYRKPVPLAGGPYRVEAETAKATGRRRRIVGRFLLEDGSTAVEAEGVFIRIR
ncbi:MAG TPA: PaaI family thioesterase [Acidimicrobiia bacterium]|nr:PaaI family thioesterase [Acidimicrobiia bacterium]